MIAQSAGAQYLVPRSHRSRGEGELRIRRPHSGGDDVEPVTLPALDYLGISGSDDDPGLLRGGGHRLYFVGQHFGLQPLLDNQGGGETYRGGPGDGQVVDRPVDRELSYGPAGEDQRMHHEGICGQGELGVSEGQERRVGERGERRVIEDRQQEALYELVGRLASGPVAHVYAWGLEFRWPAAVRLDRVGKPPLAHSLEPISTFSNVLRPKL